MAESVNRKAEYCAPLMVDHSETRFARSFPTVGVGKAREQRRSIEEAAP